MSTPPTWQTPPEPIAQILNAAPTPTAYLSPSGQWLLELEQLSLCPIADLATPTLGLAGVQICPQTNGPARSNPYRRMWLTEIARGDRQLVDLPEAGISFIRWSPDGQKLAFTLTQPTGLELWAMALGGQPWQITAPLLNATYGSPYQWQTDQQFLCKVVPADRGLPPIAPSIPLGPAIQENLGRKTPNRTYTHLLRQPHDEALFEYYFTSTLEQITLDGTRTALETGLIGTAIAAPDGQYILCTTWHRPFSYQVPVGRFPLVIKVLDAAGKLVQQLADLPLDEDRSIKFDAVRLGPRRVSWRGDRPATLYWLEALDNGDPKQTVPHRDVLLTWDAPFTAPPQELWRSQYRFRRVIWGRADVALAWEQDYDLRQLRWWRLHPDQPATPPSLLGDRSFEDSYSNPGLPATQAGWGCWQVLRFTPTGNGIYLAGQGASPQGLQPFLDQFNFTTGQTQRLWQCQDPYFERVIDVLDDAAQTWLTWRQSQTEPPNIWLRSTTAAPQMLTDYRDRAPQFAGIHKELVHYHRADGVPLSAKLYLPAGYDPVKDGALPMVFWIYPAEFKDRELAGQVTATENTFSRPQRTSILFLLTQGYAVLDDPTIPIIGEGDAEPNDAYVAQLIAGAEAAVTYVVNRGVADRDRLAVGGHSYGAFTTANLLAHTRLFKLGIARSGAYNRTLTPFGFQGEQRNFWEATATYEQMAPFTHAAKITAPLLLIHGANDSNAGTYPVQTERLYEALKGLGATVRWVELPLEDHGYRSQEAVGHVLWEMVRWCQLYL